MLALPIRLLVRTFAFLAARPPTRACARHFLGEVRGGVTAIVAIVAAVMALGASVLMVDHNWLVDQRDVLKKAADAAAMAAAIEMMRLPPETPVEELRQALQRTARAHAALNLAHLGGRRLARARETLTVAVTPHRERGTVDVVARASLGGTLLSRHFPVFGSYAGPGTVAAAAGAESVTSPVEMVLAIDVSTSMDMPLAGGWMTGGAADSRMEIVKRAAGMLVDTLDPGGDNRVAIGVVPWQVVVRLNATAQARWAANGWAEYPRSRHYDAVYACRPEGTCTAMAARDALPADPGEAWQGCLDEHRVFYGGHAALPAASRLLAPPSESAFAQAIFPSLQGRAYRCLSAPLPGNFHHQACYGENAAGVPGVFGNTAPQHDCGSAMPAVLPLTIERAAIDTAISALRPIGNRTYSSLGVLWGQRLLSQDWRQVWGGDVQQLNAGSGAKAGTRKVIVLLTDGEDNPCGLHDPLCKTNGVGMQRETACSAAKAAGTEIFVIAAIAPRNVSGALERSLRACSSGGGRDDGTYVFLNNSDAASLEAAFAEIGKKLRIVRRTH